MLDMELDWFNAWLSNSMDTLWHNSQHKNNELKLGFPGKHKWPK
jgi:hypothetical protein